MKLEDNLNDPQKLAEILNVGMIAYDMVSSICGELINSGSYRSVYDYNLDDKYVVKLEPNNTNCNIVEYMIWEEVKGLNGNLAWVKEWFAPVKWISPNGRILVMRKTKEDHNTFPRPAKVPKFFWDVKWNNFGWIGKNYVCHDYGQFYNMINYPKGMVNVKWY